MAIPPVYFLIWECIKLVISDKTVNTAIDHWTKGTSTKLDDLLWRLLETAAGIEDHDLQVRALEAGVSDLTAKYQYAKEVGEEAVYKAPTKPPITVDQMRILMSGDTDTMGVC